MAGLSPTMSRWPRGGAEGALAAEAGDAPGEIPGGLLLGPDVAHADVEERPCRLGIGLGEARDEGRQCAPREHNGLEAVEVVERLKPDIAILDIMMPDMSGLEVTARLNKSCPQTGIIILSMCSNEAYIYEASRSGAKAYILKDNTADELKNAIMEVHAGRRLFSALPYLSLF